MLVRVEDIFTFVDTHNGAVTAIATIIIAAFTVILAFVTRRQALLTREVIKLSRNEFTATHRPKLKVRHVRLRESVALPTAFFNHGEDIDGSIVVVNVGGTKAKIVDSRYRIFFSQESVLPISTPYDRDYQTLFEIGHSLDVGESRTAPIVDKVIMKPAPPGIDVELRQFERGRWKLYVMGWIRYQDEVGADRFMGFCRLRNNEDGRFRAVDDPDYEYED